MSLHYQTDRASVHHGDMLDVLRDMPDQSVDVVITDPPYGLADHHPRTVAAALAAWLAGDREHVPDGRGFMGREWDRFIPPPAAWDECLRVLKPGGWLLAFAAPRTADLMGMSIRLAGFEIRDGMQWLFAQGFPKGQDLGKVIDRMRVEDRPAILKVTGWLDAQRVAAGVSRRAIDDLFGTDGMARHWTTQGMTARVPAVAQWARLRELIGFGPDMDAEVARLNDRKGKTGDAYAAREIVGRRNAGLAHGATSVFLSGTGQLDEDRMVPVTVAASEAARTWQGWNSALKPAHEPIVVARKSTGFNTLARNVLEHGVGALNIDACRVGTDSADSGAAHAGRWPTNVLLSHAPECEACACGWRGPEDADSPHVTTGGCHAILDCLPGCAVTEMERQAPGAAAFFPTFRYQAKAPASERPRTPDGVAHPTVKPLDLMRWLVRLVCPPGGLVLDPFGGSGTTAEACAAEGARCVTVERDEAYLPLIVARLDRRASAPPAVPAQRPTPAGQLDGQLDMLAVLGMGG